MKNCIYCGTCEETCSRNVHKVRDSLHEVLFEKCVQCGDCVASCNTNALKIFGEFWNVEDLMGIVLKDTMFFEKSGGGLTVSGGEPMMQFEPLLELLQEAKKKNLHVCLDTSGFAPTEYFERILPFVNIFLYDYKATSEKKHREYTGVGNKIILRNLKYLCEHGAEVFLRCPIIPGLNDDEEHLQAIADLSRRYLSIKEVNLMPYHDMAKGKAAQIGQVYALKTLKTMDRRDKERLFKKLREMGCQRLHES